MVRSCTVEPAVKLIGVPGPLTVRCPYSCRAKPVEATVMRNVPALTCLKENLPSAPVVTITGPGRPGAAVSATRAVGAFVPCRKTVLSTPVITPPMPYPLPGEFMSISVTSAPATAPPVAEVITEPLMVPVADA